MVRLGGKSTRRTEPLTLQKQTSRSRKLGRATWAAINELKSKSERLLSRLQLNFQSYNSNVTDKDLLDYLKVDDSAFFEAFRVPIAADGMTRVGKKGRAVDPHYLLRQWYKGRNAAMYRNEPHIIRASEIWKMAPPLRQAQIAKWRQAILKEKVANIYTIAKEYNEYQSKRARMLREKDAAIFRSKRIIGCTTTAAAKYGDDIQMASPGVLLLEEAGEVLESHSLTAMGPETQQLILIGDHKYANHPVFLLLH